MASITIRRLDEKLKQRLRCQAAEHGRSLEAEVREILRASVAEPPQTGADLFEAIRRRFEPFGGIELDLPKRGRWRRPPDFTK